MKNYLKVNIYAKEDMDQRVKNPERKTRYQIKQEEKRRMKELEHKQRMQMTFIGIGIFVVIMALLVAMAILEGQGIV